MPNGSAATEKKSGCKRYLVIGCVTLFVLGVVIAVAGYFAIKGTLEKLIESYTSAEPLELPRVQLPADRIQTVIAEADGFKQAVKAGQPTDPLVLSGEEINALIQHHPDFEGISDKVYVTLEDEKIHGQVSIPLGERFRIAEGRYLNGSATFTVSVVAGRLIVFLDSLEVGDSKLPEAIMKDFRQQNLAEKLAEDPEIAPIMDKLESVEVTKGQLVITPRSP